MATGKASYTNNGDQEDYIDIEITSSSSPNHFFYPLNSPPKTREFEFQMTSISQESDRPTTSPADELFYMGNLLPLHLPPRLKMLQKLLQNSQTQENYQISKNPCSSIESCHISPTESCRESCELNPDENPFIWTNEMRVLINDEDHSKKSFSNKVKQIKQALLGQKLKASRAYLKSLFSKSSCSDEFSCAKARCNVEPERCGSKGKDISNKQFKKSGFDNHRKSFSGAIQMVCENNKSPCSSSNSSSGCSSVSSSFSFSSSNGFCYDAKRIGSGDSEIENSIEGAIAYCKQSHQKLSRSRKFVERESTISMVSGDQKGMNFAAFDGERGR